MAPGGSQSGSEQPVQQSLFATRKPRGGKRRGAGRPARGVRAGSPHKRRAFRHARYPLHVVLRASPEVGNLRRRCVYLAIQRATEITSLREGFRLVHVSIQRTHVHLLVEADSKLDLVKGMQGFQVSAARRINAAIRECAPGRRGAVFPDRYHATEITSPRQARHVLAYVMLNWRRHQEDRQDKTRDWKIDWFSSAVMFPDWTEYGDAHFLWRGPLTYAPLLVFRPRTWLLREGWKKHSPTISCYEVPPGRHPHRRHASHPSPTRRAATDSSPSL